MQALTWASGDSSYGGREMKITDALDQLLRVLTTPNRAPSAMPRRPRIRPRKAGQFVQPRGEQSDTSRAGNAQRAGGTTPARAEAAASPSGADTSAPGAGGRDRFTTADPGSSGESERALPDWVRKSRESAAATNGVEADTARTEISGGDRSPAESAVPEPVDEVERAVDEVGSPGVPTVALPVEPVEARAAEAPPTEMSAEQVLPPASPPWPASTSRCRRRLPRRHFRSGCLGDRARLACGGVRSRAAAALRGCRARVHRGRAGRGAACRGATAGRRAARGRDRRARAACLPCLGRPARGRGRDTLGERRCHQRC